MPTENFSQNYIQQFQNTVEGIAASNASGEISYHEGVSQALRFVLDTQAKNGKVIMVGNGGSAGIASHMTVDYWKNGNIRSVAFNDTSLLTCVANDYSYEEVFAKPIEMFADAGDILFAISSSGGSKNIHNAVKAAQERGCKIVTFSGFDADNPLRAMGDINFYVPASSYGYVEILHNLIIHQILDTKLQLIDGKDVFNKNQDL